MFWVLDTCSPQSWLHVVWVSSPAPGSLHVGPVVQRHHSHDSLSQSGFCLLPTLSHPSLNSTTAAGQGLPSPLRTFALLVTLRISWTLQSAGSVGVLSETALVTWKEWTQVRVGLRGRDSRVCVHWQDLLYYTSIFFSVGVLSTSCLFLGFSYFVMPYLKDIFLECVSLYGNIIDFLVY